MIQQVAFAASADEARPVLQGVQTIVSGDEITLAATDGFRISVRHAALLRAGQETDDHDHPGARAE